MLGLQTLPDFRLTQSVVGGFGALVDSVHDFIACGHAVASSQNSTFYFPLMGPMSMICSNPNICEGTPEYTAFASSTSFFL